MKMNLIKNIIYITFLFQIKCLPTFKITGVNDMQSRCDRERGYFQFSLSGEGSGFSDELRITLPLKQPENCKSVCMVRTNEIFCTMDALIYDLSGTKILEVYEEEPQFDNIKIEDWTTYFTEDHRVLNSATNCEADQRQVDPEEGEEQIFAAYDAKNIEILGCFRNKNNFSFQLTKVKDDKSVMKDSLDKDIYFDISFVKPTDEKALCVIPKNSIDDVYTVRCALKYGGEIEIGKEASGSVILNEKKYKIVFRGLLIPPTVVDECTE